MLVFVCFWQNVKIHTLSENQPVSMCLVRSKVLPPEENMHDEDFNPTLANTGYLR